MTEKAMLTNHMLLQIRVNGLKLDHYLLEPMQASL